MRTTVTLDDHLLEKAVALTGMQERGSLLREALTALIERESAPRLASLGGTEPDVVTPSPAAAGSLILADTSVWVDHLRAGDATLERRLHANEIACHPYVVAEVALARFMPEMGC